MQQNTFRPQIDTIAIVWIIKLFQLLSRVNESKNFSTVVIFLKIFISYKIYIDKKETYIHSEEKS